MKFKATTASVKNREADVTGPTEVAVTCLCLFWEEGLLAFRIQRVGWVRELLSGAFWTASQALTRGVSGSSLAFFSRSASGSSLLAAFFPPKRDASFAQDISPASSWELDLVPPSVEVPQWL